MLQSFRGEAALAEISRSKPNLRNRIGAATEQAVVDLAIAEPGWGQVRSASEEFIRFLDPVAPTGDVQRYQGDLS
jgi:hypothetical protein